ncbi:MAG TPA: hypothetical protein VM008_08425 [Phycisphaerae bacterium]|nr:hypothetical protein [Phycisphaerae bacterium]
MMRLSQKASIVLLCAGLTIFVGKVGAQNIDDDLQVARSSLKADRQATVAKAMQLSAEEGKAFWPLYDEYRAKMDKVGDATLKLIKEYAKLYPDIPDARASVLLQDLCDLEKQRLETQTACLMKMEKVLSPAKTLRFAQVENRLDLALRAVIAAQIPLVPIEGRLAGTEDGAISVTEGVPGGNVVKTYQLKATVAAIDTSDREITLVNASGIKTTVKAGPEVTNFDQINVGDQLKITAAQEMAISVVGADEPRSDGVAQAVLLAPKEAKPGGLIVETAQVTAKVTAIDVEHRQATLQFEDGTTRTVSVRPDVDLSKRKVGDQVVIRKTETLAVKIEKP